MMKTDNGRLQRRALIETLTASALVIAAEHGFTEATTIDEVPETDRAVAFGRYRETLDIIGRIKSTASGRDGAGLEPRPMPDDVAEYVATSEAAEYLGRKEATLMQWSTRGNGPFAPYKSPSGRLMWSTKDIRAYVLSPPVKKNPRSSKTSEAAS